MFSPRLDQAEVQKRVTDIEQLQQQHNQFRKLMETKVRILENENTKTKGAVDALIDSHKEMADEISNLKAKIAACLVDFGTQMHGLTDLGSRVDAIVNVKIDLAGKIADARKRMEKQDIAPKKAKTTK